MSSALPLAVDAPTAASEPHPIVWYSVEARAEPGVMPRVLELFAKRGVVPRKWHSAAAGADLTMDLQIAGLERDAADYIARCMRQIAGVETVLTSDIRHPG